MSEKRIPDTPSAERENAAEAVWQRRNLKPARRQAKPHPREAVVLSDPKPKVPAGQAKGTAKKPASTASAAGGKKAGTHSAPKAGTKAGAKPGKKPGATPKKNGARSSGSASGSVRKRAANAGRKRAKQLPRELSIVLAAVLLLAIGALIGLMLRQEKQYKRFQAMRAVVERQVFYEGTQVDGIDVSGMTLRQAQEYWGNQIEPTYAARTVTIANVVGRSVTSADLGYSSDYLDVLSAAWDAGRSGSLEERYREITERTGTPASYSVSRSFYDESLIERYVQAASKNLNSEPTEPRMTGFDMDTREFSFAEGTMGQKLDEEKMAADIRDTLNAGSGSITLVLNEVRPEHTVEDIRGDYGLIASARTNATSSSSARLSNLRVALSSINGVSVKSGETFSFNGTVGQRTIERGYQPAAAYAAGEIIEEVGGGICQVSTTLFNAAVKSGLEITERHNHSMPVGYVDKGKDATVDWKRLDFKFTNNTDSDIFINAYLNSEKRVIVGIYGKMLADGEYITVEGVTTGTEDFTTVYEVNPALAPGTQNVKQEGRTGYTAEAYKILWDKDGRQLSRTLLCKSHYLSRDQIVEIAP